MTHWQESQDLGATSSGCLNGRDITTKPRRRADGERKYQRNVGSEAEVLGVARFREKQSVLESCSNREGRV